MRRIFWDTNIFIYLLEDFGVDSERVALMRRKMVEYGDQLITSALTLGEVTVKARRNGDPELAQRYENAILASAVVVAFDVQAARIFSEIRSQVSRKVHPADAIQLASAAVARVDLFVTNDKSLHSIRVPRIESITSVERAQV